MNGLGLAMVIPCIQSILAEVWVAKQRGRAFGMLFTFSALSGIGMKYAAIVLGTEEVGSFDVSHLSVLRCCQGLVSCSMTEMAGKEMRKDLVRCSHGPEAALLQASPVMPEDQHPHVSNCKTKLLRLIGIAARASYLSYLLITSSWVAGVEGDLFCNGWRGSARHCGSVLRRHRAS